VRDDHGTCIDLLQARKATTFHPGLLELENTGKLEEKASPHGKQLDFRRKAERSIG
jgi:hypothetical protein